MLNCREIAFSANPYALSCLTTLVPATQILFGSDFPFRKAQENVDGLAGIGFSPGWMSTRNGARPTGAAFCEKDGTRSFLSGKNLREPYFDR